MLREVGLWAKAGDWDFDRTDLTGFSEDPRGTRIACIPDLQPAYGE